MDKIHKIQSRPWLCIHPWTTTDFRAHKDLVKITCCCNLDLDQVDRELDFSFLDGVRADMADHRMPSSCHVCKHDEDLGQQSERVRNLLSYPENEIDRLAERFESNDRQVLIKFSNKCSLACRSCKPDDSSFYASKFGPPSSPLISQDLSEDPHYWSRITHEIEKSHVSGKNFIIQPIGGETLLQAGFHRLLRWLESKDISANATLRLTTSLAVNLSDDLVQSLARFKKVTLMLSIDSVGENYHCVRWPATFDRVERNLNLLIQLHRSRADQLEFAITPVFSINNIFYLEDFLDWWHDWAHVHEIDLWMYSIHLYHPNYLAVEALPEPYRSQVKTMIGRCLGHEIFARHLKMFPLKNYLENMHASLARPIDPGLFTHYLKYTALYDHKTQSDIDQCNSRLFSILTPEHRSTFGHWQQHHERQTA